jgi:hypothetical protein
MYALFHCQGTPCTPQNEDRTETDPTRTDAKQSNTILSASFSKQLILKFSAAASKKRMGFEKRFLGTQSRGQAALETQTLVTPPLAKRTGDSSPRAETRYIF